MKSRACASLILIGLLSGCSLFKPPSYSANGPTVPTGSYDNPTEKWVAESVAAKRNADKLKTESELKKLDR